jgi:hypothetical protein
MMTIEKLESAFNFSSSLEKERCNNFKNTLSFLTSFMEKYREEEAKLPYHINLIDELHADENAHSRILGKFLMQKTKDGRFEILEHFIQYLKKKSAGFGNIQVESPEITQEKERIDLWIRDKRSGYAIIIENKIHWAKDQESQLSRYIEKTIGDGFKEERIFVVYLPPADEKDPDEQTWGKYEENFKERYVKLSFKDDILPWLNEILPDIEQKEVHLRSALEQYIDHLEGMFNLRPINNKMNMKLQEFIKDDLKIQENKPDDAFEILTTKKEELEKAFEQIELLEEQLRKNIFQIWAAQVEQDFHGTGYKLIDKGENYLCWEIVLSGDKIGITLEFDRKKELWYCGIWIKNKKKIPSFIIKKIEQLLEDGESNNSDWRGHHFNSKEIKECYPFLKKVIKALIEK